MKAAAFELNQKISEAEKLGLQVQAEVVESEFLVDSKRTIYVVTKCFVKPDQLEC